MTVSDLMNHLEALKREYGDVEVDVIAEALWTHEELIQHIVSMEERLPFKEGAGLQTEGALDGIAYSPRDKRIKLMSERF